MGTSDDTADVRAALLSLAKRLAVDADDALDVRQGHAAAELAGKAAACFTAAMLPLPVPVLPADTSTLGTDTGDDGLAKEIEEARRALADGGRTTYVAVDLADRVAAAFAEQWVVAVTHNGRGMNSTLTFTRREQPPVDRSVVLEVRHSARVPLTLALLRHAIGMLKEEDIEPTEIRTSTALYPALCGILDAPTPMHGAGFAVVWEPVLDGLRCRPDNSLPADTIIVQRATLDGNKPGRVVITGIDVSKPGDEVRPKAHAWAYHRAATVEDLERFLPVQFTGAGQSVAYVIDLLRAFDPKVVERASQHVENLAGVAMGLNDHIERLRAWLMANVPKDARVIVTGAHPVDVAISIMQNLGSELSVLEEAVQRPPLSPVLALAQRWLDGPPEAHPGSAMAGSATETRNVERWWRALLADTVVPPDATAEERLLLDTIIANARLRTGPPKVTQAAFVTPVDHRACNGGRGHGSQKGVDACEALRAMPLERIGPTLDDHATTADYRGPVLVRHDIRGDHTWLSLDAALDRRPGARGTVVGSTLTKGGISFEVLHPGVERCAIYMAEELVVVPVAKGPPGSGGGGGATTVDMVPILQPFIDAFKAEEQRALDGVTHATQTSNCRLAETAAVERKTWQWAIAMLTGKVPLLRPDRAST